MAIITVPVLIVSAVASGAIGAFWGAQADDAVEVATGEKDSFPILQIILILAVLGFLWNLKKKVTG